MRRIAGQYANTTAACRCWIHALCLTALIGASGLAQATPQDDLYVLSVDTSGLTGNWQSLLVDGSISASVGNMGGAQGIPLAYSSIRVLFFEDINGNDAFDPAVDTLLATKEQTSPIPGPGQEVTISTSLGGPVRFRDCRIHAFVDPLNEVVESNENNNVRSSDPLCTIPLANPISTTVEWSWTTSTIQPTSNKVVANPVVVDMNADGIPDIVFSTAVNWVSPGDGILRCLSGNGAGELFSVDVPGQYVKADSQLAVGDIDLDGLPEIIARWRNPANNNAPHLIAFEHDGTFKWTTVMLEWVGTGGPAIANLDGTGTPEIIMGRQVLDSSGNLLWTGTGDKGANAGVVAPLVADVNLDGTPEVVAGSTIYSSTGAILHDAGLGDGCNALGNFDTDAYPEIVLVKSGRIWLLEHDGTIKWGPTVIVGPGGAPLVADLDGDGEPEIGIPGDYYYTVLGADGNVKWAFKKYAGNYSARSSTAFDLDGDGSMEVLYNVGAYMYILRGADGTEAGPSVSPVHSMAYGQHAIVADVDNDGQAEIVLGIGSVTNEGIRVIGDAGPGWANTRKIWNQYTYHVTNVNEDGTIPLIEQNSWQSSGGYPDNAYRQNQLAVPPSLQVAPDLTASRLLFGPGGSSATIRVGNGGAVDVATGLPISFYDGDPSSGGTLLGTVTTAAPLTPGAYEDVVLTLSTPPATGAMIYAVADDSGGMTGMVNECDESNNVYSLAYGTCGGASWHNYGTGVAGNSGTPGLTLSGNPVFGSTITLTMQNTSGAANVGYLVAGLEPMSFQGQLKGTLLVKPIGWHAMMMPPGNTQIPISIPAGPADCGLDLYAQLIHADQSGFSGGFAFSRGLHMILGP